MGRIRPKRLSGYLNFDPLSGKTRMFGYPIDSKAYHAARDAKIGDICSVSNQIFVLIEQGKNREKNMQTRLFLADLTGATDLSNENADQTTLQLAEKKMLLDLRALGWTYEKTEGLAVLPDKQTRAVVNDNDFGLSIETKEKKRKKKTQSGTIRIAPKGKQESATHLWVIRLPKTLHQMTK